MKNIEKLFTKKNSSMITILKKWIKPMTFLYQGE